MSGTQFTTLDYRQFLLRHEETSTHFAGTRSSGDTTFTERLSACPADGKLLRQLWTRSTHISELQQLNIWVQECPACGWWQVGTTEHWCNQSQIYVGVDSCLVSSILRRTSPVVGPPMGSLRDYLRSHPDKLRELHTARMEQLVGSVLADFYNCEVRHVGRSGDGGIDLLLILKTGEISAIQVKRRIGASVTEHASTVRELVGAMIPIGLTSGKVVTTADQFGPASEAYVDGVSRKQFRIELVNRDAFLGMMRCVHRESLRPWACAIREADLRFGHIGSYKWADYVKRNCESIQLNDVDLRGPT